MRVLIAVIVGGLGLLFVAPGASAQTKAPPNDNRADAVTIRPPAGVSGTSVGATTEDAETVPSCLGSSLEGTGTLWYQFTATSDRRMIVRLTAAGEQDAVVDVFRRVRSQNEFVGCEPTDEEGVADVEFRARENNAYLVRVTRRRNSVAGPFRLEVFVPLPFPRPPGIALPGGGVSRTLDPLSNTADAWAYRMREGTTYRVNLVPGTEACVSLGLYLPGTSDYEDAETERAVRCGGYFLHTPGRGEGGTHSFLVQATGTRGRQPYRLGVAPAGLDDMGPGLRLGNHTRVRGSVSALGVDVVDVYRFALRSLSHTVVRLNTGDDNEFNLYLIDDRGRRLDSTEDESGTVEVRRLLRPGRYLAYVRATNRTAGGYSLSRVSRVMTRLQMTANGSRGAQIGVGDTARLELALEPGASGPARIVIERFDPTSGWHYLRTLRPQISGGRASVGFTPPVLGRYRASAEFLGTRTASPSHINYKVRVIVVEQAGE